MRKNDLAWAQEEIAALGNDPDLELALLVDEQGEVLASTKNVHIGLMIQEAFPSATKQEFLLRERVIKKAQSSFAANVVADLEGKSLLGIVPVHLGSNEGFIRPTPFGPAYCQT